MYLQVKNEQINNTSESLTYRKLELSWRIFRLDRDNCSNISSQLVDILALA